MLTSNHQTSKCSCTHRGDVAWQTARQDVLSNRHIYVVSYVAIDTSWQLHLIQTKTVCNHLHQVIAVAHYWRSSRGTNQKDLVSETVSTLRHVSGDQS